MNQTSTEIIASTPTTLLELGIKKGIDIDQMEKLLGLQERWEAKEAKKTFLVSKAKFQGECPELTKSKKVSFQNSTGGKTEYNYIPLSEITKQTKKLLSECGLSYEWKTKDEQDKITISCILSHIDGHSEENTMTAGLDNSGKKNAIQQRGSTVTYLQRYTLIGALGISSADQDIDGQQPKQETVKLSAKDSTELLSKSMAVIDKYTELVKLQEKARPFLREQQDAGMHKGDVKKLEKYIGAHYESLKSKS